MNTLKKRMAKLEAGRGTFDANGRDTNVIGLFRQLFGDEYNVESIPVGYTMDDVYAKIVASPTNRIRPNTTKG